MHYTRIHTYPRVLPVNYRGDFVCNRKGEIQGPVEYSQWLKYSYYLLEKFHENRNNPKFQGWNHLYFRREQDFYTGSYQHFAEIFLILIAKLPRDQQRFEAYDMVRRGVDLYDNLDKIDKNSPVKFRNQGGFYYKNFTSS